MSPLDFFNSLFVLAACGFALVNLKKLYEHKEVKGQHVLAPLFFACWGWWNMIVFYPVLEQWWTWGAHSVLATINTLYAICIVRYHK